MLIAVLTCAVLASACAATPTVTATRELTAAELAVQAEADRTFAATPAYLARVQARANEVESVRFEVYTRLESPIITLGSRSRPLITGEQTGDRSRIAMDMAELMGPAAGMAGLDRDALKMTMVTEGNVVYVNSPLFEEVLAQTNASGKNYDWLSAISTGWGRIDAGASGSDLMSDMGMGGGANADQMLGLLGSVGEVLDGGEGEVRGVPVRIAHAQVSIAQVLEQSGQSLKEMGLGNREAELLEQMAANVAVYIDGEGRVLRLEYTMDLSGLADLDPNARALDLQMWQRVEFFDHGAYIDVAVPLTWTDITDEFEDLLEDLN